MIGHRALSKDRDRRYPAAAYQIKKLVRRHNGATVRTLAVVVAIVIGGVLSTVPFIPGFTRSVLPLSCSHASIWLRRWWRAGA